MILSELLQKMTDALEKVGILEKKEAQRVVMASLDWTSLTFFEHLSKPLSMEPLEKIDLIFQRRLKREPLSRIMGMRGFWKEVFFLSSFTLDPRPETEGIIELALSFFTKKPPPQRIIDLGTGTGCLLLSLLQEFPHSWGVGIDCQIEAIQTAQKNALHLGLTHRVSFMAGSWMNALCEGTQFDLIVSNPPYIPTPDIALLEDEVKNHDPLLALDGGADGLSCYRVLISQASKRLAPRGCFILEMGEGQGKQICNMSQHFFKKRTIHCDLSGKERYVMVEP